MEVHTMLVSYKAVVFYLDEQGKVQSLFLAGRSLVHMDVRIMARAVRVPDTTFSMLYKVENKGTVKLVSGSTSKFIPRSWGLEKVRFATKADRKAANNTIRLFERINARQSA
jgi:hypothetical protein